jgi:outer membrane lipoprotein-sorting protein
VENKLENLKEKMDETILKDVYFSDKQYKHVLSSIKESKFQKQVSPYKNKFNNLLSTSVLCILFLGIIYFAGTQLDLFKDASGNHATKTKITSKEEITDGTVYTPPEQDENFKEMTKEEILTKMLNTVDHFETAKGEFKVVSGGTLGETLIEYELSLNNKFGGYIKENYITEVGEKITSIYYKDGIRWTIDENSASYAEGTYNLETQESKSEVLTSKEAFSGDEVASFRASPYIGGAGVSLFPNGFAYNYARDINSWDIENQNEEILGHNTLVIKGEANNIYSQSFRMWVDKDTGILVKYETYNSEGKIVEYLYPTKLEINVPIDSEKFKPNLAGLTKMETDDSGPRINTGDVEQSVPEDLKLQWEEAKKNPNETSILHKDDYWYIFVKIGYTIDRIEANGKEGTLYLVKQNLPPEKKPYNFYAIAEGYKVDTLEIVYE